MKFVHRFVVAAPLDAVAAFHRRSAGMGKLTPPPVRVEMHAAPVLLGEGDEMAFSLRLGPLSLPWRARIERVGPHGFDDRQLSGPFAAWVHRHVFVAVDEQNTLIHDQVEARPGRGLAGLAGRAIWLSMPLFFAYRAWKTRRLLARSSRPRAFFARNSPRTGTTYRAPTGGAADGGPTNEARTGTIYRTPTGGAADGGPTNEARTGTTCRAPTGGAADGGLADEARTGTIYRAPTGGAADGGPTDEARTGTIYRAPTGGAADGGLADEARTGTTYRAPTGGAADGGLADEGCGAATDRAAAPLLPLYTAPEDQPFFRPASDTHAALLVHGFLGTPAEMAGLAGLLQRRGWSTQAILLPGFGRDIHSLNEQRAAGWLKAVRRAAADLRGRYGTLMLVGNSMGAALALAAAAQVPVEAVALTAPFWKVRSWLDLLYPNAAPFIPGEIKPFERLDLSNPLLRAQARQLVPAADFDNPQTVAAVRSVTVATGIVDELGEAGRMGYDAAPYVQAPTLVVQGRQDPLVLPRYTARLAARLPHLAELVEVQGDHLISRLQSAGAGDLCAAFERFAARFE